jgi:hypothetical protein
MLFAGSSFFTQVARRLPPPMFFAVIARGGTAAAPRCREACRAHVLFFQQPMVVRSACEDAAMPVVAGEQICDAMPCLFMPRQTITPMFTLHMDLRAAVDMRCAIQEPRCDKRSRRFTPSDKHAIVAIYAAAAVQKRHAAHHAYVAPARRRCRSLLPCSTPFLPDMFPECGARAVAGYEPKKRRARAIRGAARTRNVTIAIPAMRGATAPASFRLFGAVVCRCATPRLLCPPGVARVALLNTPCDTAKVRQQSAAPA